MRTSWPTLREYGIRGILSSLILLAWVLPGTSTSHANGTPKPPPPPPATPTDTPEPADTPEPTETPEPTDTQRPTDTPEPTARASDTPAATATQKPTDTAIPGEPPQGSGQSEESATSRDCQSSVQGAVSDRAGQEASGATVVIELEGWSDSIMTDDSGYYGFAGLCAGPAKLSAYLVNGQVSQSASVSLNGHDRLEINLSTVPMQATLAATAANTQPPATPEPGLPATGFPGWFLAGAALVGLVLLLSAGIGRVLGERTQDHN